ncbi:hypothetical protein HPT25_05340 [Bacillus sp. BRMEA1]|uniref:hypothetical protein n=1 Tax=Neobacillus endophyticus TaxID=2738405 RepID=UPI0015634F94|nr:hypothetical protein [Neobacillus endophyticus]NRD76917.1 hypothetical protein [Neobacillus endophyticus]
MKVLFGSVEYFEREMISLAKRKKVENLASNQVKDIHSEIKYDLIHDFICDVNIKKECLMNLNLASERLLNKYQTQLG